MGRLRIFAGPNGSGKSTLSRELSGQVNLGHYLNADDLFREVCRMPLVDLNRYGVSATAREWTHFWSGHGLRNQAAALQGSFVKNNLMVFPEKAQSYEAAILADFLRHLLLKSGQTFSFETVFSHPSKIEFMKKASKAGYRTYLYFVSAGTPDICVERVRQRVHEGGHKVPGDKIESRYMRTLENLLPAMRQAYRAFIFDNSKEMNLIAESTPENNLLIRTEEIPAWFHEHVVKAC